jgi:U2 small nuclear ribonucleoprotein A'
MKLTPELLAQAPSTINPVKERQLDLRGMFTEILHCDRSPTATATTGYKIPAIENLGVTKVRTQSQLSCASVNISSAGPT